MGDDQFARFWAEYPRRQAKLDAMKAWDKALKIATPDAIIEGCRRYAQVRVGQDPQFTKMPATWLRAGCWMDEPDPTHLKIPEGTDPYKRKLYERWNRGN